MTEFDKVIRPGGVGKVSAAIHTTTFKGQVSKSVNVTTNDPENSRFTLQIKANVAVPLDVQPSENISFNGKSDSLKPQELTITSTDKSNFDITSVTPSQDSLKVTVTAAPETGTAPKPKAGTVASGANRYKVVVSAAPSIAIGRLSGSVTLKTTHPKAPEQVIRVFGTVTGDVEVVPQNVTLSTGASAAPEARVQHVAIKKLVGDPLKILSAASDNPQIATTLKTVKDGREYDLEVKYTGQPAAAGVSAKITVKTNDPRQPSLEIPVWGRTELPSRAGAAMAPQPVTVKPVPKAPPSP